MSALEHQEGGNHYKDMAIQPIEFVLKNNLGFCEGNVVKYVSRWRTKGGVEDLKKARHYLDLLIEMEDSLPEPAPKLGRYPPDMSGVVDHELVGQDYFKTNYET